MLVYWESYIVEDDAYLLRSVFRVIIVCISWKGKRHGYTIDLEMLGKMDI